MSQNMRRNIAKVKAIEKKNEAKLLAVNSKLDNGSGIYFLTRQDSETGIKFSYVGQAVHIKQRMLQHMSGYQHIDLSIRKHGLLSERNPSGWDINFLHFPKEQLDEKERYYITLYAQKGYQSRNKDTGGCAGKQELGERKPSKGYRDGLLQGKKNASREIANLFDKHLNVSKKSEKPNKIQDRALEKFMEFLDFYKEGNNEEV